MARDLKPPLSFKDFNSLIEKNKQSPFGFTQGTKKELIKYAGLEDSPKNAKKVLIQTEKHLNSFRFYSKTSSKPANTNVRISKIEKLSKMLINEIDNLDFNSASLITFCGFENVIPSIKDFRPEFPKNPLPSDKDAPFPNDFQILVLYLTVLKKACHKVSKILVQKQSKGRPAEYSILACVRDLSIVFKKYHAWEVVKKNDPNYWEHIEDVLKNKFLFINSALKEINVVFPTINEKHSSYFGLSENEFKDLKIISKKTFQNKINQSPR